MTTSGGSVWDRGPGDGDDHAEAVSVDGEPVVTPAEGSADEHQVAAPARSQGEPVAADTVWSRGPSIDEPSISQPASRPQPVRPEPVLPQAARQVERARSHRDVRRPVAVSAAAAVLAVSAALAWTLGVVGGDDPEPALAGDSTMLLESVVSSGTPSTSGAVASPPATSAAPAITTTSFPTTTSSTTTSSTTTSSTTTSSTTTTSSSTSSTTVPEPAPAVGPQVAISGHVGPCKFGSDCLIAHFTISGFDAPQREFVCEFANGSRYAFRFDGVGAEGACATSAADGTITIEVAGVRSETITR